MKICFAEALVNTLLNLFGFSSINERIKVLSNLFSTLKNWMCAATFHCYYIVHKAFFFCKGMNESQHRIRQNILLNYFFFANMFNPPDTSFASKNSYMPVSFKKTIVFKQNICLIRLKVKMWTRNYSYKCVRISN